MLLTYYYDHGFSWSCLLKKNNSHAAAGVAQSVQSMIHNCLNVDICVVGTAGGSDTNALARKVSQPFGTDQDDCSMHIFSLILLYTLGLRENMKTESSTARMKSTA